MKFLIIRFTEFDKIIATITLIKAIKQKFPDAIIHYVTSKPFENYINRISEIEKIFYLQGDITPIVLNLLKEKYTHCIDLQSNTRSNYIGYCLQQQYNSIIKKYSYPSGIIKKIFNKKYFSKSNITTLFLKCPKKLNLSLDNLQWYYPTLETDELKKEDIPTSHLLGYYCIDVSNLALHKEKVCDLINHTDLPVILLGNVDDSNFAEEIKQINPFKIYNACGKYTQAEELNILKRSKYCIATNENYITLGICANIPIVYTNAKFNFPTDTLLKSKHKYLNWQEITAKTLDNWHI